ncbi:hypothetical protein [Halolamina sediminis]|jgi:hypothetical protein|uniref:hypothetical protein n=1 Tax=Halolamina sediminis TaxID=1480675 RepID=UPI0006B49028|nr:hypothetical protein [Halolamina sediminis]
MDGVAVDGGDDADERAAAPTSVVVGNDGEQPPPRVRIPEHVDGRRDRQNEFSLDGEAPLVEFLSWLPVEFGSGQTVSPDATDQSLAIRVYERTLLDDGGDTILETAVGSDESDAQFGSGVYRW